MKKDLSKFYEKFKLYIFPAAIGLASLTLIVLVIYPQTIKLVINQKKSGEISQKAKFLEDKAEQLEKYNPDDLKIKVDYSLTSFPVDKDYISVIKILQNIIVQSGFNIVSLSLESSRTKDSGNFSTYGLKLDTLGTSSQLPALLSYIESSYRLMRVITLEASSERESQIAASISIEVLFSAPPAGFGNIDSPLPQLSEEEEKILSKLATVGRAISQEQSASQLAPRGKPNPFE